MYHKGGGKLSAKWRRNKRRSEESDFFQIHNRRKSKKSIRMTRIQNPRVRWNVLSHKPKVLSIPGGRKWKEPEPLIDVLEGKDELTVVAGLVGFRKEDLAVHVKSRRLTLSAEASDRKYHKSLNLPVLVIPKTMRITYKNGVLEVRLKKGTEEKTIDKVAG